MPDLSIQAQWLINDTDVPSPANQTLVQLGNGAAYISFGHINPPSFQAPPGTLLTQEMVEGRTFPVVPVARVQMPISVLSELRDKIDQMLAAVAAEASS